MTNPHDHRVAGAAIAEPKAQLAAEQLKSAKLREAVTSVVNHELSYYSKCCRALALPHDDTALKEWGAGLLEKAMNPEKPYTMYCWILHLIEQLRSGKWKP